MSFRDPHFRVYEALAVFEKQRKRHGIDSKTQDLVDVLCDSSTDMDLTYAWDKYTQSNSRKLLDAFLLCDAPLELIRQVTGVNINALKAYASHIFDTTVFRDVLDKLQYVQDVVTYQSEGEAQYLKAALTGGPQFLAWMVTGRSPVISKEVLQQMMANAFYKAQVLRTVPIDSPLAKAARDLAADAARCAIALEKIDPQESSEALNQFMIALTHRDDTISEETIGAPAPETILH